MAAAIGQEIRKSIVQKNKQEAAKQANEGNGDKVNGDLRTSAENSEHDFKDTTADGRVGDKDTTADGRVGESEDMKNGNIDDDDESACGSSGSESVAGIKEGFRSGFGNDSGCGSSSACGSSSR